jgi:acylphosphatase
MAARRYRLTGRVQGVGFRYFTYRSAQLLGVRGWVRNREDGDVEVHAEAESPILKEFEGHLRSGPFFARVLGLEWTNVSPSPFLNFSIER